MLSGVFYRTVDGWLSGESREKPGAEGVIRRLQSLRRKDRAKLRIPVIGFSWGEEDSIWVLCFELIKGGLHKASLFLFSELMSPDGWKMNAYTDVPVLGKMILRSFPKIFKKKERGNYYA